MLKAALEYGYRHWDQSPIYLNDARLKKLELPEPRYARLVDAAAAIGVPSRRLMWWIEQRRVPDMRCQGPRRTLTFDMEAVRQIVVSKFPPVEARAAARRIGIPHKVYAELRRHGDIPCTHLTPYERCVAVEDTDAFAESITGRAQNATNVRHLYSLSHYLGASVSYEEKAAVIRDIRDGRRTAYLRGRPKIGNLWLTENVLAAARQSKRSRQQEFTLYHAMCRFGLGFYESCAAFRAVSGATQPLDEASLDKLEQFLDRHELLKAICRSEKVDSKALVNAVRRSGAGHALRRISAGCGPAKRGNVYVIFVAKSEIQKVRLIARQRRRSAD